MGALSGRTQEAEAQGEAGQVVSTEALTLQVDLTADTSRSQEHFGESASIGGLGLTGWSSSPSKFTVSLSYPYFGPEGYTAAARTDDGTELGEDLRENGDLEEKGYEPGDKAEQVCSFAGPPEGARRVTVTVFEGTYGQERRAVGRFTIDLETGEVTGQELGS